MSLQFTTHEVDMIKYFVIHKEDETLRVYYTAKDVCVFFLGRPVLDYIVVKTDEQSSRKVNLEELEYFEFTRVKKFLENT